MTKQYPAHPYPLSDLIDRLSIDILKSVFIIQHRKEYKQEINDILFDIEHICKEKKVQLTSDIVYAILCIALTNREIWLNESKARQGGTEQDQNLAFTHSCNGLRNSSKNLIAQKIGDRKDLKLDCLAERFLTENFTAKYGNWDIFEGVEFPK